MEELSFESSHASRRPSLAKHARLQIDTLTGEPVLLSQEVVLALNRSGYEILQRCDGTRTLAELIRQLEAQYSGANGQLAQDVLQYIAVLTKKGLLRWI